MSAFASALALALALPGAPSLTLAGETTCPTVAEIEARLAAVAPPKGEDGEQAPAGTVHVSSAGHRLRLELTRADGQVVAARELDAAESCADLAAGAAVVVASWQSDLDPRTRLEVALPAPRAAPRPARQVEDLERSAPPKPQAAPPTSVGFGLLASTAGGNLTPGATLHLSVELPVPWLGLRTTLAGTTARAADIGTRAGAASWWRAWLAVGPEARVGREPRLEAHAQAVATLVHVEGVGLPQAASETTYDLGVASGASITRWLGNASYWVGVDVLVWPGRQNLLIQGLPDEGRLPRLDVLVAAGLGLGRTP